MNLLIIGSGDERTSFAIRGRQIGNALGARVTSTPTPQDFAWAEAILLVKRYGASFASQARVTGVPVLWDALDFWAQPADNGVTETQARALLSAQIAKVQPTILIAATEAMAEDAKAAGVDAVCLPHHTWRGLDPMASRTEMGVVAYQGNPLYLGRWAMALQRACQSRGWRFVINPEQLWQADLIVALRDGPWDGWICRQWKSGVKLGNAIAVGRPVLTQATAAQRELDPPGSVLQELADLPAALDLWSDPTRRQNAYDACRARAKSLRLPAITDRYRAVLSTVKVPCLT
jgi:hypothetical protein